MGITVAGLEVAGKICPYCQMQIKHGDSIYICDACRIPHHIECWQHNGGCTTFGCTEVWAGGRNAPPPPPVLRQQNGYHQPSTPSYSQQPVEYGQYWQGMNQQYGTYRASRSAKNRITAGILGILLGGIGAHKFYRGQIGWGIVYLMFCWTYVSGIVGLIEGITYLCMSDEEFAAKYG